MDNFRSNCPLGSALDIVGDKWSLLIVRDMLIYQKFTFKDFENSDEQIATNILSKRLKLLEGAGILTKHKLKTNKKTNVYVLTQKGRDLIYVLVSFFAWGTIHLKAVHPNMEDFEANQEQNEINKKIKIILANYIEFSDNQLSECV